MRAAHNVCCVEFCFWRVLFLVLVCVLFCVCVLCDAVIIFFFNNKTDVEIYMLMLVEFLEYEVPPVFKLSDVNLMRINFCNRLLNEKFPV